MKCQLICTEDNRSGMEDLLQECGMEVVHNAEIVVLEKNCIDGLSDDSNECSLTLVIDANNISEAKGALLKLMGKVTTGHDFSANYLIGKCDEKFSMIQFEEIMYFSARSNDVYFHTDKSYYCKFKLYELEEGLHHKGFIRINKSEIVNIKTVKEIVPWFNSRYVLKLINDQELVVTKSYTKSFRTYIGL